MSPDLEQRIRRVENSQERMDERLTGVNDRVRDLTEKIEPLAVNIATLTERSTGMVDDIVDINRGIGELRTAVDQRNASATQERRAMRTALISLVSALGVALISTIGGIVVVLLQ